MSFRTDLSQVSRITLNLVEHHPVPPKPAGMPSTLTNCPTTDRAALARHLRYEIIVEALKEVKSRPQLTYHSKSTQTSPLQASAKVVEGSSELEDESCDGTPTRCVVVFDSDEEGLDRVLPASYPVDEAYESPDLSPPTPAQRPRPRVYYSPSPQSSSSDYLPMPGAFPLTPCLVQEHTTPHNENTQWAAATDFEDSR